jgi:hypothetical protein
MYILEDIHLFNECMALSQSGDINGFKKLNDKIQLKRQLIISSLSFAVLHRKIEFIKWIIDEFKIRKEELQNEFEYVFCECDYTIAKFVIEKYKLTRSDLGDAFDITFILDSVKDKRIKKLISEL